MTNSDTAAYWFIGAVVVLIILSGCACPRCEAQTLDATQALEIRETIYSALNAVDYETIADSLFLLLGVPVIPEGTETVTLHPMIASRVVSDSTLSLVTVTRYLTLQGILAKRRIPDRVPDAVIESATGTLMMFGAPPATLRTLNLIRELEGR